MNRSRYFVVILLLPLCFYGQQLENQKAYTRKLLLPGDTISVSVAKLPELSWAGEVNGQGEIWLPFAEKPITAICRDIDTVAREATAEYAAFINKPQVIVKLEKAAPPALVVVNGAVATPTRFQLNRPVHISELLRLVGGVSKNAGKSVRIFPLVGGVSCRANGTPFERDSQTPLVYPLQLIQNKDVEADAEIYPGDGVTVLENDLVYVDGSVASPSALSFSDDLTLVKAMEMAGGITYGAKISEIHVSRRLTWQDKKTELVFDLRPIAKKTVPDPLLQPNDVIKVFSKSIPWGGHSLYCKPCFLPYQSSLWSDFPDPRRLSTPIDKLPLKVIE